MPKMKAYASFDLYLADRTPKAQAILRALRRFVARSAPSLVESVKWGNGCWLGVKEPVVYVYADVDHVQFGFFRGSALDDPRGLLQGNGQYVRHVKLRRPADLDVPAFTELLQQAVARQSTTSLRKAKAGTKRKASRRVARKAGRSAR